MAGAVMTEHDRPRDFWLTDCDDNSGWTVETKYDRKTMYGACNVFHVRQVMPGPKLDRRAIFEFCIVQLLEKYRERALKEIETLKRDPKNWDGEDSLEDVSATDFVRQMESLGIVSFSESLPEGTKASGDR